jgi:hypothetical protein
VGKGTGDKGAAYHRWYIFLQVEAGFFGLQGVLAAVAAGGFGGDFGARINELSWLRFKGPMPSMPFSIERMRLMRHLLSAMVWANWRSGGRVEAVDDFLGEGLVGGHVFGREHDDARGKRGTARSFAKAAKFTPVPVLPV